MDWKFPEGRRVSKIYFDPSQGSRTPLESQRMYAVAMVDFIGSGFNVAIRAFRVPKRWLMRKVVLPTRICYCMSLRVVEVVKGRGGCR
jgi:hypothetical protein